MTIGAVPEDVRWLTLGKACRVLGVDESTLRRWADSGHVRAFRTPGGHRRFAESEIMELVSGRKHEGESYSELGDAAVTRIRRQVHRGSVQQAPWYTTFDDTVKGRLRPLGRQLVRLAARHLGEKTHRSASLEEARELGREHGRVLAATGMGLAQAVEAFIFFRRSLDASTKQASQRHGLSADGALGAWEQMNGIADQVLIGLIEAYEVAAEELTERKVKA